MLCLKKKSRIKTKNLHIVNRVEANYSEKQQQKTMAVNVPSENSLWNSFPTLQSVDIEISASYMMFLHSFRYDDKLAFKFFSVWSYLILLSKL